MFTKALLPDTLRAIKLVAKVPAVREAYLAGGTALALQIGHRISVDLDFFTDKKFNEKALSLELSQLSQYKEDGKSWQTIWGYLGETKFSIFYYQYPLLEIPGEFEKIRIVEKKDIAAMKIHALEDRGTTRDFIDLYFLAKEFSIEKIFSFYDKKYGVLEDHLYSLVRAMSYFEDAENEEYSPRMLVPYDWEEIKKFFISESQRLWKKGTVL